MYLTHIRAKFVLFALIVFMGFIPMPAYSDTTPKEKAARVVALMNENSGRCIQKLDTSHAVLTRGSVSYEIYYGVKLQVALPDVPPPPPSLILIITKKSGALEPVLYNDWEVEGRNYDPAAQADYEAALEEILSFHAQCKLETPEADSPKLLATANPQ